MQTVYVKRFVSLSTSAFSILEVLDNSRCCINLLTYFITVLVLMCTESSRRLSDAHVMYCVYCAGGCARCTFRRSYEDADVPLMTAVQCTEPPSTAQSQTRQLLLNDGRQFVLTTASSNDSDISSFQASHSVTTAPPQAASTANPATRTADDAEPPADLSLHDEIQYPAATAADLAVDSEVRSCPMCHRSGFATLIELTLHINSHLDVEDALG